jgi:hypothetical protein
VERRGAQPKPSKGYFQKSVAPLNQQKENRSKVVAPYTNNKERIHTIKKQEENRSKVAAPYTDNKDRSCTIKQQEDKRSRRSHPNQD